MAHVLPTCTQWPPEVDDRVNNSVRVGNRRAWQLQTAALAVGVVRIITQPHHHHQRSSSRSSGVAGRWRRLTENGGIVSACFETTVLSTPAYDGILASIVVGMARHSSYTAAELASAADLTYLWRSDVQRDRLCRRVDSAYCCCCCYW